MLQGSVSALLLAAIRVQRKEQPKNARSHRQTTSVTVFTEEMRKDYTIICPQMSPIHFELLRTGISVAAGYNLVDPDRSLTRECDQTSV